MSPFSNLEFVTESVECYRESSSTEKASTENRRATRNPVPRIAEQRERPDRELCNRRKMAESDRERFSGSILGSRAKLL
ncbi:unnamed protein product [Cochlearia groenlandica]